MYYLLAEDYGANEYNKTFNVVSRGFIPQVMLGEDIQEKKDGTGKISKNKEVILMGRAT
jgi:hypothetical protein